MSCSYVSETKLLAAMKNIESQLNEYNKSMLSVLTKEPVPTEISESAMSEPVENISKSIIQ